MPASIRRKMDRLAAGESPRVMDLFSGCGGLTAGFTLAGYRSLGGLDVDRASMRTHWSNFHPGRHHVAGETPSFDLKVDSPNKFGDWAGIGDPAEQVDVLIGGPPCQAYSRIGRNKLSSLAGFEGAHRYDERGFYFDHFLAWAEEVNPLAVMIENVPDSLNYDGLNVPEYISRDLSEMGFEVGYTILNAANYGVPQYRERVFIIGLRRELGNPPVFPTPTHRIDRPPGYRLQKSRIYALVGRLGKSGEVMHACPPPEAPPEDLEPAVTCEEALSDLPFMGTLDLSGGARPGCTTVPALLPYGSAPASSYQELMRTWPGFSTGLDVSGNNVRWTPRDFETFALMKEGEDYMGALAAAEHRVVKRVKKHTLLTGIPPTPEEYEQFVREIVPPYARDKFNTKWVKLCRDRPSHTVVAHLSVDTYSHIHYDSLQARGISVREAARLQSFPDGFKFLGDMSEAFSMIGNAVPPLLAFHLALSIKDRIST